MEGGEKEKEKYQKWARSGSKNRRKKWKGKRNKKWREEVVGREEENIEGGK